MSESTFKNAVSNNNAISTTCYRCFKEVNDYREPLYSINAIAWSGRIGAQTGAAWLCEKCADGLEDYLDQYWRMGQNDG